MKSDFDYSGAIAEGYNDEEISSFLRDKHKDFDYEGAVQEGYSPSEINQFLSTYKPERSNLEKAGRISGQFALGAAESAALPYELASIPLSNKKAQNVAYRQGVGEDIERLLEQKSLGIWDEQDQELLDSLQNQIKNPLESEKYVQTADIGIRNLIGESTGLDVEPEGFLEKAANFIGLIKKPSNILKLKQTGVTVPQVIKAIAPTGKETLRGLGGAAGLTAAQEGEFGPIGTMAAILVGDVIGGGAAGAVKGVTNLIKNPKKALAEANASFISKDKLELQKQIIKDFRDSGIQADLGSISDSNIIRFVQSRLAQSGLVGKDLHEFRDQLTNQIKDEYKVLAESLGEAKSLTNYEAGQIAQEGIKKIRDSDLASTRELYDVANRSIKENASVDSKRISQAIDRLERELKPGSIKSAEQQTVINTLEKIKKDLYTEDGVLKYAKVKNLMNDKIALNDIINYEIQGGAKQLLKGVVAELDRAIISHGKENPVFARNYIGANKRFSAHAKTFRNKVISNLLKSEDPTQLLNKMNTVHGIRGLENVLSKTMEGREILKNLKRLKFDEIIGKNLVDSTTQQVKLGTFSNLLKKGKNKELVRELLGAEGFKRLERLQKNAGKLAESSNRFYNASQSATVAGDAAVIYQAMNAIVHALYGNPWGLIKLSGGIVTARKLSSLLSDPEFLKLSEEAVLASQKGDPKYMIHAFMRLAPYILPIMQEGTQQPT